MRDRTIHDACNIIETSVNILGRSRRKDWREAIEKHIREQLARIRARNANPKRMAGRHE